MSKKIKHRVGRPRKNVIAEPTKIVSFRIKQSILEMLEKLTIIYNEHCRCKASRCEMLEILIKNEYKNLLRNSDE